MVKLYTKQGDKGKTTICGMKVEKNHPRLSVLGALDELNSSLGMVLALNEAEGLALSEVEGLALPPELKILEDIQRDLMEIGASLGFTDKDISPLLSNKTAVLEKEIDRMWENLPLLQNFILPGGGKTGSLLHFARAVCRRAERKMVFLAQKEKVLPEVLVYLNRLSDFLFALARWINQKKGHEEKIWPNQRK